MASYFTVVTRLGAALEAASKASGRAIRFSHLAVGDGGGSAITPSAEMTALIQEKWRGELNDLYVDPDNPGQYIAEAVIPENVGGFTLREVGLYTEEGILYLAGNSPDTVKPLLSEGSAKSLYIRLPVAISSEATVNLLIDPSKVLATQAWVTSRLAALENLAAQALKAAHNQFLDYFMGWYAFNGGLHPDPTAGMEPLDGSWIDDFDEIYPAAWTFLQSPRGQQLCITADLYEAMNTAVWHTNADGTQVSWNGIGGVPRYCLDLAGRRVRKPDLRGMSAEVAGFDLLGVGGVHGWGLPAITGNFVFGTSGKGSFPLLYTSGAFSAAQTNRNTSDPGTGLAPAPDRVELDSSRQLPVAAALRTRAWGALACVYLGRPAS